MIIKLDFDTEKDNIEDIKKVCAILQEVISRREKKVPISELDICNAKYKEESQPLPQQKEQPKKETKTAGGCRFIPYEDMSDTMSSIYKKRSNLR